MSKNLSFRRWQHDEVISFFERTNTIFDTTFATLPLPANFAGPKDTFKTKVQELDLLFKNDPGSILTGKLKEQDARRDRLYTGVTLIIDGNTYNEDDDLRSAALLLQRSHGVYDPINRLDYSSQTLAIQSLLKDWSEKPELAAAAKALKLESWINGLTTANKDFDDTFLDRNKKQSESELPYDTAEKRAETIAAWEEVEEKLNGYCAIAEDPAPWQALRSEIRRLHEGYKNTVAIREGRAAAADAKKG